jgi:hypothetical protein
MRERLLLLERIILDGLIKLDQFEVVEASFLIQEAARELYKINQELEEMLE